jgi:hypothetical protein
MFHNMLDIQKAYLRLIQDLLYEIYFVLTFFVHRASTNLS